MLFELLCNTIYDIITNLFMWVEIPQLDGMNALREIYNMAISNGIGIFNFFIDGKFIGTCCGLVIAVEAFIQLYYFVMWLLKKIPMIGVK